jgi:hypothetical protein
MYAEIFEIKRKKCTNLINQLYNEMHRVFPSGTSLIAYEFITTFLTTKYNKNFSFEELKNVITDCSADGGIDAVYFGAKSIDIYDFKCNGGVSEVDLERVKLALDKYIIKTNSDFTGDEAIKNNIKRIRNNRTKKLKLIIARKKVPYTKEQLLNDVRQGNPKIRGIVTYLESKKIEVSFEDVESVFINNLNLEKMTGRVNLTIGDDLFSKNQHGTKEIIAKISLETIFKELVDKYGIKVINSNVRSFLNKKIFSNKIIETLKMDPKNFYIYHNGITITCSKIEPCEPTPVSISIHNPQIVNGAQTIFGLYNAFKEGKIEKSFIKNGYVICKIIEADEELTKKICETSNTQNVVKSEDLRSNDEIQIYLEEYFKVSENNKYIYNRKKGANKGKNIVSSLKLFQWVYAALLQKPFAVKNEKQFLFDIVTKKGKYKAVEYSIRRNKDKIMRLCDTAFFVQNAIKKEKDKNKKGLLRIMEFYLIAKLFEVNSLSEIFFENTYTKLKRFADKEIKNNQGKNYSKVFNQSEVVWNKITN